MGYPDSFRLDGIPEKGAYRQAGNSVCVQVVKQIAEEISKVLSENNTEEAAIDNVQNDTLVGTLRNKNQLHVCLQHNFYYCPKSRMPGNPDELRYVALNMTPRIFGKESGIHYIGRINKISLVKRSDITEIPKNTDEIYYRLAVSRWVQLTSNIEHCNFSVLYLSSSKDIGSVPNSV